jgi:hypothetical protein
VIGTVKITRVRFLEDDVYDGGIPFESYDNAREEFFECDDVEEAVRAIQREGLTFASTGNDWAGNPDGSVTVDYGTGEREDATAHLIGFLPSEVLAIIHAVG